MLRLAQNKREKSLGADVYFFLSVAKQVFLLLSLSKLCCPQTHCDLKWKKKRVKGSKKCGCYRPKVRWPLVEGKVREP